MFSTSCKLIDKNYVKDKYGVIKEKDISVEIPIIKVEDIYSNEFYQANQAGYTPTLRIKISALNYFDETELIYNNIHYTIIRHQNIAPDEIVLICERKIKNV